MTTFDLASLCRTVRLVFYYVSTRRRRCDTMQVIPAIDVLEGRVVRLTMGRYDDVTGYGEDPVAMLESWIDRGATLVHVVDLGGARSGAPERGLWRRLGATGLPFQVGGGIRSRQAAREAVEAGAARVVLGTAAVWAPDEVAAIVDELGAARVVGAIDVRDGRASGAGWLDTGRRLEEVLRGLDATGLRRVLATGIARDGTMAGPDLDLLIEVAEIVPDFDVIASGGVGSLDDLTALRSRGVGAVIVGRALYEGAFTLEQAIRAAS
jgi:phosphoribosylformimino-5-aminoimidazole carboxamide ribotide isomerase